MSAPQKCDSLETTDFNDDYRGIWIAPTSSTIDAQTDGLRKIFESAEDLLTSPDCVEVLRDELFADDPNFMNIFITAKRDLLNNDCGIIMPGEKSASKTSLINLLVKQELFATTSKIIRIWNSQMIDNKDNILKKEVEVKDVKKLETVTKRLTDISCMPDDLNNIYYVDVFLPVPMLKGNVIIVDPTGIGEKGKLEEILLNFLPHTVLFVFIVDASNFGVTRKDKLSKILNIIMDNRDKMPRFDPREVLFLTNQWDSIDNADLSSEEDGDVKNIKEDQQTRKDIQKQLEDGWCCFDVDNVFRVSSKQVKNKQDIFFTDEYNRFEAMLWKTIEKNSNERVEFYYRFLKDITSKAWRRITAQCRKKEEQKRMIVQNNVQIEKLQSKYNQATKELECYKTKTIDTLTDKLYAYLQSRIGRKEILNPPGAESISNVKKELLKEVVPFRLGSGIQRWCDGQEVQSIIEAADAKIRTFVEDTESELQGFEIDTTEMKTISVSHQATNNSYNMFRAPLYLQIVRVVFFSLPEDDIYNDCLKHILKPNLRESFEISFGVEYSKTIVCTLNKSLIKTIERLLVRNEGLIKGQKKYEQIVCLQEKIQGIHFTTEKFGRSYGFI